jgi:hypothetical protein
MDEQQSSAYLVEWGGAASDKSYKHAGSLTLTGPFDTVADALVFGDALDDQLFKESFEIVGFAVIVGRIDLIDGAEDTDPLGSPGGVHTPRQRLVREFDPEWEVLDRGELSSEAVAALDRWWPDWEAEWQTIESHMGGDAYE